MNGWGQWGSFPRNKFHYFIEETPGNHLSACGNYGLINTKKSLDIEPPIEKRCKDCMRVLRNSQRSTT